MVRQQVGTAGHEKHVDQNRCDNGHQHGCIGEPGRVQSYEEEAHHCSSQDALHGVVPARHTSLLLSIHRSCLRSKTPLHCWLMQAWKTDQV